MKRMRIPPSLPALCLALVAGCGDNTPAPKSAPASKTRGVERFFPLGDGYAYTYDSVDVGDGREDMLLLRVRRLAPGLAQMHTASGVRRLVITREAIRREGSGFVLRAPLDKGATWEGDNGGTTTVAATRAAPSGQTPRP